MIATGCVVLWGLIGVRSLPDVLAPTAPDLALALYPNHPASLIYKADAHRRALLDLSGAREGSMDGARAPAGAAGDSGQRASRWESGVPGGDSLRREDLAAKIAALSRQVMAHAPLDASAFRMLAEVTEEQGAARALMEAAALRSRREAAAQVWLLNDCFHRKDYDCALVHADVLMRVMPALDGPIMGFVGQIAEDDVGRGVLVKRLARDESEPLRSVFFRLIGYHMRDARTPLRVMMELKKAGRPVSALELRPYLDVLTQKELVEVAYYAWLQFLNDEELARLGLVYNPGFESEMSGLPFDWRGARMVNASFDLVSGNDTAEPGRSLRIRFGLGRNRFVNVSQVVLLGAGVYEFKARMRGHIKGKRGVQWRIACLYGRREQLGESAMFLGPSKLWDEVSVRFEVPAQRECRAQRISLVHASRSQSEEYASGEVLADDVRLVRLGAEALAPAPGPMQ